MFNKIISDQVDFPKIEVIFCDNSLADKNIPDDVVKIYNKMNIQIEKPILCQDLWHYKQRIER